MEINHMKGGKNTLSEKAESVREHKICFKQGVYSIIIT